MQWGSGSGTLAELTTAGETPQGASMISKQAGNSASARAPADGVLVGARCGPTALRIALGVQMRRLREAGGITCEEAAAVIRSG